MDQIKYEIVRVRNIGDVIIDALLTETKPGKRATNGQIVEIVKSVFESAQTTKACVAWYVTHLKDPIFRAKHGVTEERWESAKNLKADKN